MASYRREEESRGWREMEGGGGPGLRGGGQEGHVALRAQHGLVLVIGG